MFVTEPNKKYTKIPVFNKSEVFDVTGAGDTVTAVYTLALAAGADSVYAALIGNVAASLVVKTIRLRNYNYQRTSVRCRKYFIGEYYGKLF